MARDYELEIDKLLNDGSHTIRSLARELLELKLEKIPILQKEIRNLKAERTHASSDWEEKSAVYTDSEHESTTEGSSAAIVSCPDYAAVSMYDLTFSRNLSCFGIHSIGSRMTWTSPPIFPPIHPRPSRSCPPTLFMPFSNICYRTWT